MELSTKILSDITVFMKYAKYNPLLNRRETWEELVTRNKDMHIKKYPHLKEEIEENYKLVYEKKVLPSMRSMQFAGKPIEISPNRVYNCAYLPIDDWRAFSEIMFLLLGGTGVGYSVQNHHIEKLPEILRPNPDRKRRWLIADSIEGWADAVKVLIKSYFFGGSTINFDFSDIRPKGARLVTSGGKAPGPQPLKECLVKIEGILDHKQTGEKLTSTEVHDIVCHIADAVLAGGIRRAALICLFSATDEDMLSAKTGNWWELNPQRGRANNSAVLLRHKAEKDFFLGLWEKVKASGSGEPGIYFTNDKDWGTNPCVTGDTLVKVKDHGGSINSIETEGVIYDIPMKELVELYKTMETPPLVLSMNTETNELEWNLMDAAELTREDTDVIELELEDGTTIKMTPDHKVYTKNRGYIPAKDLTEDDILVKLHLGGTKELKIKKVKVCKNEDVYDITVRNNHNFFANGLLVHNCVEIALRPFQFCNLTEINASNLESQEDLNERVKVATFIGTLQAGYTDFHYLRNIWKRTTEKDALLGVSMTGIGSGRVLDFDLQSTTKIVKEENERVADLIGINRAARTTAIKPSGTTSLTLGTSSGIHAWHNDYYIRRIRVGKNEAIYSYLAENHPELVEDEYFRPHDTAVISVPQKAPDGSILRTESPLQLLERVKKIYKEWVKPGHRSGQNTHNISCTVSIREHEWDAVGEWMWENRQYYNGLSVLPYSDHTYQQAPFEDITKEKYEQLIGSLTSVNLREIIEEDDETDLTGEIACGPTGCEVT